jgi:predicted esterase
MMATNLIHEQQPVRTSGALLENAAAAMIMLHGRGGMATDILAMSNHFKQPDFAFLAPQAANHTWYPQRFIAPIEANEPYLSSALNSVETLAKQVVNAGVPVEKLILLGFSQGACLALEYATRNARRYGGVVALSGGLIGEEINQNNYKTGFDDTPIFLGCSDVDFHVPLERVQESTHILERLGGLVTERIYPGMGHTINEDEIEFVRDLMNGLL